MGDSGGPRGLVFVFAGGARGKGKDWRHEDPRGITISWKFVVSPTPEPVWYGRISGVALDMLLESLCRIASKEGGCFLSGDSKLSRWNQGPYGAEVLLDRLFDRRDRQPWQGGL